MAASAKDSSLSLGPRGSRQRCELQIFVVRQPEENKSSCFSGCGELREALVTWGPGWRGVGREVCQNSVLSVT